MSQPSLAAELSAAPGRFGLIEDGQGVEQVLVECEHELGASRCSVGAMLASLPVPPSSQVIETLLRPHQILVDIEILFASQLAVDPVALLRSLSRAARPRVAVWPGPLAAGRAAFSEAQREDHYDVQVDNVLVLRPIPRTFPDEPCFEVDRWLL